MEDRDDKLLKQRIVDLVDKIERMPRRNAIEEIFKLVKEYQLSESQDGVLRFFDLNRIHDLAVSQYQQLSLPFYVDKKETDTNQRRTYCYLMAVVMYLRGLGMLKREISAFTEVPIVEPIED